MTNEKKKNKTRLIIIIITAIAAYGIIQTVVYWGVKEWTSSSISVKQQLIAASNNVNSMCPFMVDAYTRLDNSVPIGHKAFQYNYTLIDINPEEIDIESFKRNMEYVLTKKIKTEPDLEFFRRNNVTMIYRYNDINGTFISQIEIGPDEYLSEDIEEVYEEATLKTISL